MRTCTLVGLGLSLLVTMIIAGCSGQGSSDNGGGSAGTSPPSNFSLSLSPSSGTVLAGSNLSGSLQVSAPSGFTGSIALGASNLPAGVTATFSPATISFPGLANSNFTLVVPANTAAIAGQPVTIVASGSGGDSQATFNLTVQTATSTAAGFQLDLSTSSLGLSAGGSADATVILTPLGGFTGTMTLALAGLPSGVTATFAPAAPTLGAAPVSVAVHLIADAAAAATATAVNATLTAQGSGQSQNAPLAVSVLAAGDPIAARTVTLNAIKDYYRNQIAAGKSGDSLANAVSAFMASRPEFAGAGADTGTGTAWGKLKDGVTIIVGDNYPLALPVATSASAVASTAATSFDRSALAFSGAALPTPSLARLMHSFQFGSSPDSHNIGYDGTTTIAGLRGYLSGSGYTPRTGALASTNELMNLKSIEGDSFFLYASHGGRQETEVTNEMLYSLSTSRARNPIDDYQFDKELKAGELLIWHGRFGNYEDNGDPIFEDHYAITARWVDKYWQFAQDSIVMLWACQSGFRPPDFVDHIQKKNAGAILSNTDYLRPDFADRAARYFVDRLLGANQFSPESPPQRAFPADLVFLDMQKNGLATDKWTAGDGKQHVNNLVLTPPPATPPSGKAPILAPSIQNLVVDELNDKLTLVGFFGSASIGGKVVVNDKTELTCPTWQPGRIVCNLPTPGNPGSNGKVVVELPGDLVPRRSNPRWLTQWDIPLEYSWTDAYGNKGWKFDGVGTLHFRGDVGSYRLQPGAQPIFPVRGMVPSKKSGLAVGASGSYFDGKCLNTLSGSATFEPWNTATMLSSWLKVDTLNKTGSVALLFGGVPKFPFVNTKTGSDPSCKGEAERYLPNFGLLDGRDTFPSPLVDLYDAMDPLGQSTTIFGLILDMSADFNIRSKPFQKPFPSGGIISINWSGDVAHQPAEMQGPKDPR